MDSKKIEQFMILAGQRLGTKATQASPELKKLGAQLLLSETLEYVIKGLGITPSFAGTKIEDANELTYDVSSKAADELEMLDGLCDVAYTMYWNAVAFGLPIESGFNLVCDNNLEKFVQLKNWQDGARPLERNEWNCKLNISWPNEVVSVEVLQVGSEFFAVGKDKHGKVRKPSSYKSVDLRQLL